MIRSWIAKKLYPDFACEGCVGQEYWQGCYCAYHGATGPGEGPSIFISYARRVAKFLKLLPRHYHDR